MHSDATVRVLLEPSPEQLKPLVHHASRRRRPVVKLPVLRAKELQALLQKSLEKSQYSAALQTSRTCTTQKHGLTEVQERGKTKKSALLLYPLLQKVRQGTGRAGVGGAICVGESTLAFCYTLLQI